jgi:hypothetical protein
MNGHWIGQPLSQLLPSAKNIPFRNLCFAVKAEPLPHGEMMNLSSVLICVGVPFTNPPFVFPCGIKNFALKAPLLDQCSKECVRVY